MKQLRVMGALAMACATLLTGPSQAADHAGDVAVYARDGRLMLGGKTVEVHGLNGFNIYRADFADLSQGPWGTGNPGFQTQGKERLAPGAMISFEALDALSFWDGLHWQAPSAAVALTVADYQDALSTWTALGVQAGETQVLGEVNELGKLHEHLIYRIDEGASAGAYRISLRLHSPAYASSDPFYMVFNRGLSDAEFQRARQALVQASAVPEPGGAWLALLGGVGLLAWRRARVARAA